MIKVSKGGRQVLENLTNEETEAIKKDLTLKNPVYEQVKKFSKYPSTNVPPYLTYYMNVEGKLIVPRGYKIPFEHEVVLDERLEKSVLYPKFRLELRGTQQEAVDAWNLDRENGMIVLQTGKGKSLMGCYLAYATRQKVLIIVQKTDLIDGWAEDIKLAFGLNKKNIGIIKGNQFRIGKQFTLATIQTLNNQSTENLQKLYSTFGMIITDECHHVSAKSYEMLSNFLAKYFIGLTATDMRTDGLDKVLNWLIGEVSYRGQEDVDDEDIMPYEVRIRESSIEYNPPQEYYYGYSVVDSITAEALRRAGKHVKRKSLDPQELKKLLRDKDFNILVANDIIKEYSANKSCIGFLHEKEHIRELRDLLVSKGVPEGQIQLYYGDSTEEDSVMKLRAESKEVLITLATFAKATEGTNVKAWERAFLITSINNIKNTIQAVGRIRRRKEGKDDCIVYDYVHLKVTGMSNHINTRMKAYKQNKAKVTGGAFRSESIISRGFRRN